MRINIGEQVVDTLRANSQLDWTFTKSSAEAIDGTKSGKYYAAVVIPKNFSKNMMTFFTDDAYHATLDYYNNEKLNALAPKVTGQGADTIAATINQTFSKTLTDTALNLASSMLDMLDKPEYQQRLKSFNGNIADLAGMLNDSAAVLRTYSSLTDSAKTLLASSNKLIADARASAKTGVDDLSAAKTGVSDLSGALGTSVNALGTAIDTSKTSLGSLNDRVDELFSAVDKRQSTTSPATCAPRRRRTRPRAADCRNCSTNPTIWDRWRNPPCRRSSTGSARWPTTSTRLQTVSPQPRTTSTPRSAPARRPGRKSRISQARRNRRSRRSPRTSTRRSSPTSPR